MVSIDLYVSDLLGQLRSSVTCPTCNSVSTTFDPFEFLSLPLKESPHEVYEIPLILAASIDKIGEEPIKYALEVNEGAQVRDLKKVNSIVLHSLCIFKAMIEAAKLPNDTKLSLIEVFHHRFYRTLPDATRAGSLGKKPQYIMYVLLTCTTQVPLTLLGMKFQRVAKYSYGWCRGCPTKR